MSEHECAFCARVDAWARAHCYRCDVAVTETGAEYRLCDACLAHLGLTEQPTEPEVYWRARADAAPPMPPISGDLP